jgi:hypothetical protein
VISFLSYYMMQFISIIPRLIFTWYLVKYG